MPFGRAALYVILTVLCLQAFSQQQPSGTRPHHGPSPRSALERERDNGPRASRSGAAIAPSKGLRAVFAPLVDYGEDSDEEEPESPSKTMQNAGA